jgi:dephospho-CoA kinase
VPHVVVVELPLLDGHRQRDYKFDVVVVVDTPEEVAIQRSVGRGMSEQDARARMAAQPAAAERLAVADKVVINDGSLDQLEAEVDELWAWLVARSSLAHPAPDAVANRIQPGGAQGEPAG